MSWEHNRKLLLSLGTKKYSKPAQLLSCDAVMDLPLNRLEDADNYVEPVGPFTFVYSDTFIFVCGFPWPKKGFKSALCFMISIITLPTKIPISNPVKNQESISWIRNRLNCVSFEDNYGQMVFKFEDYLVKYIQSVDPDFEANEIIKALYYTTADPDDGESVAVTIKASRPEASSKIQKILHDRNISDILPGIKSDIQISRGNVYI